MVIFVENGRNRARLRILHAKVQNFPQPRRGFVKSAARKGSGAWVRQSFSASFSSAASRTQMQNTAIACFSSSTGGRLGAIRMLLSAGSMP